MIHCWMEGHAYRQAFCPFGQTAHQAPLASEREQWFFNHPDQSNHLTTSNLGCQSALRLIHGNLSCPRVSLILDLLIDRRTRCYLKPAVELLHIWH